MSRQSFHKGLEFYKAGNWQEALGHLNEAVDCGGQNLYQILDTRAAVHLKLGRQKDALKDAKKTIDVAPERWQGYARAARVFLQLNKVEPAQTMITMALERLKETERRESLLSLEAEIQKLRNALVLRRKWFTDHICRLPIEVFGEIVRVVVEDDHTALISLLHVCRRWRTVIESTPCLWGKLVLTSRRPKAKAKLWIERTNGKLKELVVGAGAACSLNWPGNSLDGLQWDNLLYFRSKEWQFLRYLQYIRKEAAMTKWIGLTLVDGFNEFATPLPPSLTGPFSLQSLTLQNTNVDINGIKLFSVLRSCTIRCCYAVTGLWSSILKANPLLERLELEVLTSYDPTPLPIILDFDHLTALDAAFSVPIDIFTAKMPHLRNLRLKSPFYNPDVFIRHLIDTLVGGLTELKLHGCRLDDSTNLLSLLRLSPALRVLEVTNLTIGVASLLNALAAHCTPPSSSKHRFLCDDSPSDLPPILCPKLTHVNFSGCPEVQAGLLMRLIKSRLIGDQSVDLQSTQIQATEVSKIESLIIDNCPNVEKEWVKRMEELVSHVSCCYNMGKGRILV